MINIVSEGQKINCSECGKKFLVLKLIEETDEKLCEECFENKGGIDYIIALRAIERNEL